jgi:hypothetical protein
MIKFFRKIRQNMIQENKVTKYVLYAIGEIVLVVIGILIALQINNANEEKKQRAQEVKYLKNIKTDVKLNITHLSNYISTREIAIKSANQVIEHFEGKPITDLEAFNVHTVNIYTWKKFFQIDNTFQELINSGNLAIISNDSIKNTLLNIDGQYKEMKYQEEHFRYDAEILLYEPQYNTMDMNPIVQNYTYQVTKGKMGERRQLSEKKFDTMLKDTKQKNGFVMAIYQFGVMNQQMNEMKKMCNQLIVLIDKELASDD